MTPRVAILATFVAAALTLVWDNLPSPAETAVITNGFVATPVSSGIHLRWGPNVAANARIERTPVGGIPEIIGSTSGRSGFVDRTAVVNRLYTYRIEGLEHQAVAVRSDIQQPFDCSGMPQVPAPLLGVDRTEVFDVPSGTRVTFTIRAPEAKRTVIEVPRCERRPGCSDYANISAALAAVIKAGGGRVQLEAGVYEISPPRGGQRWSQITIDRASDLIFSGAEPRNGLPSTQLVFDARPSGGERPELMRALTISSGQRVLVRNIAIDWNRPFAIPGKVVDVVPGEQRFLVDDGAYYIPDPANPPIITIIDAYDLEHRVYRFAPWARSGFAPGAVRFNPNFGSDQSYHFDFKGRSIPDGSSVIAIAQTGAAVHVAGELSDIAFEGVEIWGGGGPGFVFGPNGRGFRITNSRITRKPDSLLEPGERPRLISLRGDSDARGTRGDILIESSEFAFTEDDGFNIVGVMLQGMAGTEILSADEIRFVYSGFNPFANVWSPEDVLQLFDPATLKPLQAEPVQVASRADSFDRATGTYTFTFRLATPAPSLLAYRGRPLGDLPFLADPGHASAPYVLRGNCLRDSAGGRFIVQSGPGLIEGNVTANTGGSGIELGANPANWHEGPGATDVIVRNNTVIGAGYWLSDYDAKGVLTGQLTGWLAGAGISVNAIAPTGFIAQGSPNGWLRIAGNLVVNTPGLGLLVAAAHDVVVEGNTVVNANTVPFAAGFDQMRCGARSHGFTPNGAGLPWCFGKVAARGALMVLDDDRAIVSGNVMQGTSKGVFVGNR